MKEWKVKSSNRVLDSDFVKVNKDHVRIGNGVEIDDFYTITIKDASIIVALTPDLDIILKNEYRYCYKRDLIELPAGCFEEGEEPLEVAKRELLEETGYVSAKWTYLGATVESSSKLTNFMHIFLAEDCVKVSAQKLDETEELEVMVVPFQKAIDMVMDNEICCNSSANGILKVARLLNEL